MEIKSTAKPTPAFKLLAFVTMRNTKNREAAIKDKFFVLKEDCENTYSSGFSSIIPAGTIIQADFGGDFGLYAIADINGILRKVKIELHEWYKIDFGKIPDDVVEQADKALKEIHETGSVYDMQSPFVENDIDPSAIYVIINTDEPDDRQFWSNDQGWVGDLESATIWMGHEVHNMCLPMSGGWIKKEVFQLTK